LIRSGKSKASREVSPFPVGSILSRHPDWFVPGAFWSVYLTWIVSCRASTGTPKRPLPPMHPHSGTSTRN